MNNVAFELGFDYYRAGLPLNIAQFPDQHRQDVRDGYEAAQLQQVSRENLGRFEKKMLSIRGRALSKGLEVTITAIDLLKAYVKTGGICPVTKQRFTSAENDDTDWSVDRINNSLGYLPNNIVVVSAGVNRAKSDMNLLQMMKRVFDAFDINQKDEYLYWSTIGRFYFHKMQLFKPLRCCQLLSTSRTLYERLVVEILFVNDADKARPILAALVNYIDYKELEKIINLVYRKVMQKGHISPTLVTNSAKLQKSVQLIIDTMNAHPDVFDKLLITCIFDHYKVVESSTRRFLKRAGDAKKIKEIGALSKSSGC